ncbi:MAG: ATPase domain-containing protein [Candidatus Caldarchaeales archaeon]
MSTIDVVSTHVEGIDRFLNGGFKLGKLYFIYGEEKSGKTSLALTICASSIKVGLKPLFIDCSNRLHPQRVLQILESWELDLSRLSIRIIQNFRDQEVFILNLYNSSKMFDVIILDDLTHQHRLEISGKGKQDLQIYKRLALQVAILYELTKRDRVLIAYIGQVHDMPEKEDRTAVAYRILSHWADWIIRLRSESKGLRELFIEKPESAGPAYFTIDIKGIVESRIKVE